MKELYEKAFLAFERSLDDHIRTKTTDQVFHKFSQEAYEKLFEIAHRIGERSEDIDDPISDMDEEECEMDLYDAIDGLKREVEKEIKKSNSLGTDNLLRGIVDELEGLCGSARSFISEEYEK